MTRATEPTPRQAPRAALGVRRRALPLLGLIVGLVFAVLAMHSLMLGTATEHAMSGPTASDVATHMARQPGAAGDVRAHQNPRAGQPAPIAEHSMAGCHGHPCVTTRSEVSASPLSFPVVVATSPRRPPGPGASAAASRLAVRSWAAPPRDGPRCALCVWRV